MQLSPLFSSYTSTFFQTHDGQFLKAVPHYLSNNKRNYQTHQLEEEFEINQKLDHPNIIKYMQYLPSIKINGISYATIQMPKLKNDIYDFFFQNGNFQLNQQNLDKILQSGEYIENVQENAKILSNQQTGTQMNHLKIFQSVFKKIAQALLYMHEEKQIVHNDIKPNNIFISDNNEPYLADFDNSFHYNPDINEYQQRGNWADRNLNYMSPQCVDLMNLKSNDVFCEKQNDCFCFGVSIWLIALKCLPYCDMYVKSKKSVVYEWIQGGMGLGLGSCQNMLSQVGQVGEDMCEIEIGSPKKINAQKIKKQSSNVLDQEIYQKLTRKNTLHRASSSIKQILGFGVGSDEIEFNEDDFYMDSEHKWTKGGVAVAMRKLHELGWSECDIYMMLDLAISLLKRDVSERLTMKQALNHEFFRI